jgi:hypothetical protein
LNSVGNPNVSIRHGGGGGRGTYISSEGINVEMEYDLPLHVSLSRPVAYPDSLDPSNESQYSVDFVTVTTTVVGGFP